MKHKPFVIESITITGKPAEATKIVYKMTKGLTDKTILIGDCDEKPADCVLILPISGNYKDGYASCFF